MHHIDNKRNEITLYPVPNKPEEKKDLKPGPESEPDSIEYYWHSEFQDTSWRRAPKGGGKPRHLTKEECSCPDAEGRYNSF